MTELDKDFTAASIGEAFKQCIQHMKVRSSKVLCVDACPGGFEPQASTSCTFRGDVCS